MWHLPLGSIPLMFVFFFCTWTTFPFSDENGKRIRGRYDGPKINDYDKFCMCFVLFSSFKSCAVYKYFSSIPFCKCLPLVSLRFGYLEVQTTASWHQERKYLWLLWYLWRARKVNNSVLFCQIGSFLSALLICHYTMGNLRL